MKSSPKHQQELRKNTSTEIKALVHLDKLVKVNKVEDRLFEQHKIHQKEHDRRIQIEEQKIKELARPNISNKSEGNIDTFLAKKLTEYMKKSENSKHALKQKYNDKDCTFAPKINKKSKTSDDTACLTPYDKSRKAQRRPQVKPKRQRVNNDEH